MLPCLKSFHSASLSSEFAHVTVTQALMFCLTYVFTATVIFVGMWLILGIYYPSVFLWSYFWTQHHLASSCNAHFLDKYHCLHFQHEVTSSWPLPTLIVHIHHSTCILTNVDGAQQGPWKRQHISWRRLPSECWPLGRLVLNTFTQKQDLQIQRVLFIARMLVVEGTTLLLLLKPPALQCPFKQ
jgi:hypothetical protein